jgi:hypothetical protein
MRKMVLFLTVIIICQSLAADKVYVSNALGMIIKEIRELRADEFQYVLTVAEDEETSTRVLFKDQVEYKRWEMTLENGVMVSENLFVEGTISESRKFEQGKVLEEMYFIDGEIAERRIYEYADGILQQVSAYDGEKILLYQDKYERSAAGRLRRVLRESDETAQFSSFVYAQGTLIEEWHGEDKEGLLFRYHAGEKLAEETWEGLKILLAEEVISRDGKKEIIKEDKVLGLKTTEYYDEEDLVQIERTESEDDLIEHIRYSYNNDKKITGKTKITRAAKEGWEYVYGKSGEIIRETLIRNARIIKVIDYTGEESYTEIIYRDGVPSLRIYFEGGRKVSEQFTGTPVKKE